MATLVRHTLPISSGNQQLIDSCNSDFEAMMDSRWDPNDFDMVQHEAEFAELPEELQEFSSVMDVLFTEAELDLGYDDYEEEGDDLTDMQYDF